MQNQPRILYVPDSNYTRALVDISHLINDGSGTCNDLHGGEGSLVTEFPKLNRSMVTEFGHHDDSLAS